MRTIQLSHANGQRYTGWVRIRNDANKNILNVSICEALLPVLPQILVRVRRMFDLYCNPEAICDALQIMNKIQPNLFTSGIRVPGCLDPFEMSVRAILGQQITVKAAGTIAGRIAKTYGIPIDTGIEGLTHIFPGVEFMVSKGMNLEHCLGVLGVIASRSRTIHALATALLEKRICLDYSAHPEEEIKKLMQIRGIGSWTAQYIAMRTIGYTDAFLETDIGVKKALHSVSSKDMIALAENWRPWRSYATVCLWNSLAN